MIYKHRYSIDIGIIMQGSSTVSGGASSEKRARHASADSSDSANANEEVRMVTQGAREWANVQDRKIGMCLLVHVISKRTQLRRHQRHSSIAGWQTATTSIHALSTATAITSITAATNTNSATTSTTK
jgi:hypothetical protein